MAALSTSSTAQQPAPAEPQQQGGALAAGAIVAGAALASGGGAGGALGAPGLPLPSLPRLRRGDLSAPPRPAAAAPSPSAPRTPPAGVPRPPRVPQAVSGRPAAPSEPFALDVSYYQPPVRGTGVFLTGRYDVTAGLTGAGQHFLDTAPAAGTPVEPADRTTGRRRRGLTRAGKVQSKAQQRKFFAAPELRPYAHDVARRGAQFKALPERKPRTAT